MAYERYNNKQIATIEEDNTVKATKAARVGKEGQGPLWITDISKILVQNSHGRKQDKKIRNIKK